MTIPDHQASDFEPVFRHRPMVLAYCRRRGSRDAEGIAAEAMAIAWRQREGLELSDPRPWLIATARNLLMEEYRARRRSQPMDPARLAALDSRSEPAFEVESLNPDLDRALAGLRPDDREALLLVAWEDLTPAQAARSLGIRPATFRVRFHRARHRLMRQLENPGPTSGPIRPIEERA